MNDKISHTDSSGKASMVDVSSKEIVQREASASVSVCLNDKAYQILKDNRSAKGDVLAVANIAGIQAAKKTSELIPLCHQIPLSKVGLIFNLNDECKQVEIKSIVSCTANTGVEMEALTACSVAALTIYDMLKAVQKDIRITDLILLEKKGGRSGLYQRTDS